MAADPALGRRAAARGLLGAIATGSAAAPVAAAATPTDTVWTSYFAVKHVWGYVERHSVVAGEPFDLMLSTGPTEPDAPGHVEWHRVSTRTRVRTARSREITVRHAPVSRTAAALGATWDPALRIETEGWPPGVYSASFVHAPSGTVDTDLAQIVVRPRTPRGGILLKLGTNTYQAYNAWGGYSLYPSEDVTARGQMVSFDRPAGPAFFEYDVFLSTWLEEVAAQLGVALDYASDFDVHRDPSLLDAYRLVASSAHDEYWSREMRDAFDRRIHATGGGVIFYGANAAYWQVRYADVNRAPGSPDEGRQLVATKSDRDPIARRAEPALADRLVTGRFRDRVGRPETALMGVGYAGHFTPRSDVEPAYDYRVETVDLPFFAGTGYAAGDVVPRLVGYEWDNTRPDARSTPPAGDVTVVMRGAPIDDAGRGGRAEAVLLRSASGAQVFSTGSSRWAWGLGKPGFEDERFKRLNANLVRYILASAR